MKDTIKMTVALVIFAAIACAGLAVVYDSTSKTIAERQKKDLDDALKGLFPAGDDFSPIDGSLSAADGKVQIGDSYTVTSGGEPIGVAVNASSGGFQAGITVLTGIDTAGAITGVKILQISDTPGLGANAAKENYYVDKPAKLTFYGQFAGMKAAGNIAVKKDGGTVEAITAATITSRAVSLIVKNAAQAGVEWMTANGGSN
ncbi:MAG: RnfABCDGE type electron transport complex subunit G [Spirochaetaceae bacterium]|jgi:electron transport complex protein RnfG|nr:RnfABCDGE type electron transport complex subunit G [Spirochaetaceae bacterium]